MHKYIHEYDNEWGYFVKIDDVYKDEYKYEDEYKYQYQYQYENEYEEDKYKNNKNEEDKNELYCTLQSTVQAYCKNFYK